jgi:hypothetical protein
VSMSFAFVTLIEVVPMRATAKRRKLFAGVI